MKKKMKAVKPARMWAVVCHDRYFVEIGRTRKDAIQAYIEPRGYSWESVVQDDGTRVIPVMIHPLPQEKRK